MVPDISLQNLARAEKEQQGPMLEPLQHGGGTGQSAGPVPPQSPAGQAGLVAQKEQGLMDIHGPLAAAQSTSLLIPLLLFLAAGAALAAWLFVKKRKKKPAPTPPWEKALDELAKSQELQKPEHALIYMETAAQILRSYIEARFVSRSTSQTTSEFFRDRVIVENPELLVHKTRLRECLERADLAKFAHLQPDQKTLLAVEESVKAFISETIPAKQPKTPPPKKGVGPDLGGERA